MATERKTYVTPVFRVSFPHLFEPQDGQNGGAAKYGVSAVWTPADFSEVEKKRWNAMKKALDEASREKFKKAWKDLPANVKRGLRKGEEREDMEGYGPGTVFASLTTKLKPGVVSTEKGEDGKFLPIGPEHANEDEIYPGCYARATVTVYSYSNEGKGVALGLMNIQKVADGERLDSRTNASDDFEDEDLGDGWDTASDDDGGSDDTDEDAF
jgi:hypothetical protein